MIWVVIVLLVGSIVVLLWKGSRMSDVERRLRVVCRGDAGQAERLITYELVRSPGIPREEAALRALQAFRRDNR
jgi:hypothetical protein